MRLTSVYKSLIYELFLNVAPLAIEKIQKVHNSMIYYITDSNVEKSPEDKSIEIIYGVTPSSNGKILNIGFDWASPNLKHQYNITEMELFLSPDNLNKSPRAWMKAVNMAPIVLQDYLNSNANPEIIMIFSNSPQKNRIYKTNQFIELLQNFVGEKYDINNDNDNGVFLTSKQGYDDETLKTAIDLVNNFR